MSKKPSVNTTISAFIGVLILLCFIRLLIPNKSYVYQTGGTVVSCADEQKEIICDGISLPLGIYRFKLYYTPFEEDLSCIFNVEDGNVFRGGLLCDGDILWEGRTNTDCLVYLYEKSDLMTAYLNVSPNAPTFQYGNLVIEETNLFWSSLIVNLLILWALFIGFATFIQKIKEKKFSKERILECLILFCIFLIGSIPFLVGYLPSGPDTGYHLERIESVAYSIRDGVFPIRLESFYPFGYGYANGIFYCDLSLYLPALLRLLGFSVQASYNIFGMACVLLGIITTYHFLKKIFTNIYIAFLGTSLYSLAMYHVFDSIIRGGTGFLVASIFYPVLLYGYYRLFSEKIDNKQYKTVWIPIAIGYTGILCSHILSFEFAAFWTLLILLLMLPKVLRGKTVLELLNALGAFIIFNLWFIVPFFDYYICENLSIKNANARKIQEAGLVGANFIRPLFKVGEDPTLNVRTSYQLFNSLTLLLLCAFLFLWIIGFFKKYKDYAFMNLAKICCIFSLLSIVLSLKVFPWDYLHDLNPLFEKLISVIQHPYRFIGFADLFAAITICALITIIWQNKNSILKYSITGLVIISVFLYSVLFIENGVSSLTNLKLYDMTMQVGYLSGAEYVTDGTNWESIRPWLAPKTSEMIEVFDYEKSNLGASVTIENHDNIDGYVDVPLLHYKGYKAFDTNKKELNCIKSDEFFVRTIIPAGYSGQITIRFVSPWYWRLSEIISLAGWILFAVLKIKKKNVL